MGKPRGSLGRSLQAITIGAVKAREERRRQLAITELGETIQVARVPVKGWAGPPPVQAAAFVDVNGDPQRVATSTFRVDFSQPFVEDPTSRDVDFDTPHFTFGYEVATPDLIIVQAYVVGWFRTEEDHYKGANVRALVYGPEATQKFQFNATLHLWFLGRAGSVEAEDDEAGDN
jgi:hypothetical protein